MSPGVARRDEQLKASFEHDGLAAAASTSGDICFRAVSLAVIRGLRIQQRDEVENRRSGRLLKKQAKCGRLQETLIAQNAEIVQCRSFWRVYHPLSDLAGRCERFQPTNRGLTAV